MSKIHGRRRCFRNIVDDFAILELYQRHPAGAEELGGTAQSTLSRWLSALQCGQVKMLTRPLGWYLAASPGTLC